MENKPKVLESKTKIRFQHCDPFNHLNNAAYINYIMNAREDQLMEAYDIDIHKMAKKYGKSWVVSSNQIAYIRPAFLMEEVVIDSHMITYSDTDLKVEMRMWNHNKTELKAVLWSNFVHFNLLKQKRETHSEDLMNLFEVVNNPISTQNFENRVTHLKEKTFNK